MSEGMPSYVEQSLVEGETVLVDGRFPTVYWVAAWLILILLGPLVIGVFIFAIWAVHMITTEFAVTDQRVVLKRGLLHRTTSEIAVETVEGVELQQSLTGRMFGFGRLIVRGTGEARVAFPNMAEPIAFRQAIESGRGGARVVRVAPGVNAARGAARAP